MTATLPCPRCAGSGSYRTTVRSTKPTERDTHPTVTCTLCRGTGTAPAWGKPMAGTQPATDRRQEDPTS